MTKYRIENGTLRVVSKHEGSRHILTKAERNKARKAERQNKKKARRK